MDVTHRTLQTLICLLTLFFAIPAAAQKGDVAVVVNPNNPIVSLTQAELRKIFSGEKRSWLGGQPIRLIARGSGTHERLVLLKLLEMSESEYKQYWTVQVFRGEAASEPVAVFSNGMEKEAVASIPGAIAFMDSQDVKPGMKVVKIDNHLPSETGYPLH